MSKGNMHCWKVPQDFLCKGCLMHWLMSGKGSMSPSGGICHDAGGDNGQPLGWPHPPTFSWNVGMVMDMLKSDPVLREWEHMQVDGPGTAYLFFYDKQGYCGLGQDTAYAIWAHMEEAFSEWILCSTHFTISLLPLVEAWW